MIYMLQYTGGDISWNQTVLILSDVAIKLDCVYFHLTFPERKHSLCVYTPTKNAFLTFPVCVYIHTWMFSSCIKFTVCVYIPWKKTI